MNLVIETIESKALLHPRSRMTYARNRCRSIVPSSSGSQPCRYNAGRSCEEGPPRVAEQSKTYLSTKPSQTIHLPTSCHLATGLGIDLSVCRWKNLLLVVESEHSALRKRVVVPFRQTWHWLVPCRLVLLLSPLGLPPLQGPPPLPAQAESVWCACPRFPLPGLDRQGTTRALPLAPSPFPLPFGWPFLTRRPRNLFASHT